MGLILIAFLEERKCVEKIVRMKDGLVSTFCFLHENIKEKVTHHKKGFCRNWAVRSPAWTRLDSLAW